MSTDARCLCSGDARKSTVAGARAASRAMKSSGTGTTCVVRVVPLRHGILNSEHT
jgi:hypothetical protein